CHPTGSVPGNVFIIPQDIEYTTLHYSRHAVMHERIHSSLADIRVDTKIVIDTEQGVGVFPTSPTFFQKVFNGTDTAKVDARVLLPVIRHIEQGMMRKTLSFALQQEMQQRIFRGKPVQMIYLAIIIR